MDGGKIIHKELSYKIVGILFDVFNELGYGYQEKIYERAIERYFVINNVNYKRQAPYKIAVKGEVVGRCFLDFLVEDKIVLELKIGNHFLRKNIGQISQYFKATKMKLGILVNFTSKGVKFIRIINLRDD